MSLQIRIAGLARRSVAVSCMVTMLGTPTWLRGQEERKREATVGFVVTNYFGRPLPYQCSSFVDTKTKVDLAGQFTGLRGQVIPFGQYRYVLSRTDVSSKLSELWGEISVSEPTVWLSLSHSGLVTFSGGHEGVLEVAPARTVIVGTVKPRSEGKGVTWVRLQPLYQDFKLETDVDANGEFRIYRPLTGAFLVLVFREQQLLAVKSVVLNAAAGDEKIEIDLATDKLPNER
jgi:hypothetical protein